MIHGRVLLVSVLLTSVFGSTAFAAPEMCEGDPIIRVDGHQVRLATSFPWAQLSNVGGVTFDITVPAGSSVAVTYTPSAAKYTVNVSKTGGDETLAAKITVNASTQFDVFVTVTSGSIGIRRLSGTSNTAINVTVPLGR